MKIRVLILWHYYDPDGKFSNCGTTLFTGTAEELNERLNEEFEENAVRKSQGKGITIAQQLFPLPEV